MLPPNVYIREKGWDVRFTPESGHSAAGHRCLLSANSRHWDIDPHKQKDRLAAVSHKPDQVIELYIPPNR